MEIVVIEDTPKKAKPLVKNKKGVNKKKRSEGEERVANLLLELNILAKEEEWWPQCKDKGVLRFDFFVVVKGGRAGVIEVDGRQHFELVPDLGVDEIELQHIRRRDIIKNKFAKERGLSMLRIAYVDHSKLGVWVSDYLRDMETATQAIYRFSSPLLYVHPFGEEDGGGCVIS